MWVPYSIRYSDGVVCGYPIVLDTVWWCSIGYTIVLDTVWWCSIGYP